MIEVLVAAVYEDGTKSESSSVSVDGTVFMLKVPKEGLIVGFEATGPLFKIPVTGSFKEPFEVKEGDYIDLYNITFSGCEEHEKVSTTIGVDGHKHE